MLGRDERWVHESSRIICREETKFEERTFLCNWIVFLGTSLYTNTYMIINYIVHCLIRSKRYSYSVESQ
jgi:hypothetical protein